MRMDLKVKKSFHILTREGKEYVEDFGGNEFNFELYGLTSESINDFNRLPEVVELARDLIKFIRSNYTSYWNTQG